MLTKVIRSVFDSGKFGKFYYDLTKKLVDNLISNLVFMIKPYKLNTFLYYTYDKKSQV